MYKQWGLFTEKEVGKAKALPITMRLLFAAVATPFTNDLTKNGLQREFCISATNTKVRIDTWSDNFGENNNSADYIILGSI